MKNSQGFRLNEKTDERIRFKSNLKGISRSLYVSELIENATKVEAIGKRVAVSYGLSDTMLSKLQRLSSESGRSQGEVIEWLVQKDAERN
jgi:predicted DNA-binding protein